MLYFQSFTTMKISWLTSFIVKTTGCISLVLPAEGFTTLLQHACSKCLIFIIQITDIMYVAFVHIINNFLLIFNLLKVFWKVSPPPLCRLMYSGPLWFTVLWLCLSWSCVPLYSSLEKSQVFLWEAAVKPPSVIGGLISERGGSFSNLTCCNCVHFSHMQQLQDDERDPERV